jgi:hypothetical protein
MKGIDIITVILKGRWHKKDKYIKYIIEDKYMKYDIDDKIVKSNIWVRISDHLNKLGKPLKLPTNLPHLIGPLANGHKLALHANNPIPESPILILISDKQLIVLLLIFALA